MGNFQCFPVYERNKLPSHLFKVKNIDDTGREVGRGLIEANKNDLVFYQKGHDPIRWPLMSLRRYGFDTELFSFESGRRCKTGPGLYAFKCKKGERLFNLVKENAQHCGEEARNNSHTAENSPWTHPPRSRPVSANGSLPRSNGTIQHHSPISIRSTHSSHSSHLHNTTGNGGTPVYENGDVVVLKTNNGLAPMVQYVNTADMPQTEIAPSSISFTVPQTNGTRDVILPDDDSSNYIDDSLVNYASLNLSRDEELQITEQTQRLTTVDRDENGNKPTEQDHHVSTDSIDKKLTTVDAKIDTSDDKEDIVNGNIELGQELNRNANASTDESSSVDSALGVGDATNHSPHHSPTHTPMGAARTSPQAYYANLDTVGELPNHYNFTFYSDLRTPRSTSSRSSMGSEQFTFEPNGGNGNSRSPSEHSYANLDSLTEAIPLSASSTRHRTSSTPGSSSMVLQPPPKGRVNYIELDMETLGSLSQQRPVNRISRSSSMTSSISPPKTPSSAGTMQADFANRTDSYATIDFDRTHALASTNSNSSLPPNGSSGRRTRHDSRSTTLS